MYTGGLGVKGELIDKAVSMLESDHRREIYLGCDGFYYVTYSNGLSPTLHKSDVESAVESGRITPQLDRPDVFVLRR